jgi:queuine/archaeosine tRNA-ribosyltransferase
MSDHAAMLSFTVTASSSASLARLGRLAAPRLPAALATPTYMPAASRGAVPHLTPDELAARTAIAGVYMALEDCDHPLPNHGLSCGC